MLHILEKIYQHPRPYHGIQGANYERSSTPQHKEVPFSSSSTCEPFEGTALTRTTLGQQGRGARGNIWAISSPDFHFIHLSLKPGNYSDPHILRHWFKASMSGKAVALPGPVLECNKDTVVTAPVSQPLGWVAADGGHTTQLLFWAGTSPHLQVGLSHAQRCLHRPQLSPDSKGKGQRVTQKFHTHPQSVCAQGCWETGIFRAPQSALHRNSLLLFQPWMQP